MLIRYIFIWTTNQSEADTEFPDSDIFESDICLSLEAHGIFEYILGISENIWYLVTKAMGHKASEISAAAWLSVRVLRLLGRLGNTVFWRAPLFGIVSSIYS